MWSVVVVLPASMWATMPILRTLRKSKVAMASSRPDDRQQPGQQKNPKSEIRNSKQIQGIKSKNQNPGHPGFFRFRIADLFGISDFGFRISSPLAPRLPGKVGEGLVRLGHLDGVLALGHGL